MAGRPWLTDAIILCRQAGLEWQQITQRLAVAQRTISAACAIGRQRGDLPDRSPPAREPQDAIWERIRPQIEAMATSVRLREPRPPAPKPRRTWADNPSHLQALVLCRQAGMSRLAIMHHLDIGEAVFDTAIKRAEAIGIDVAPRRTSGTQLDDDAVFATIEAEVRLLLRATPAPEKAPAPEAPPPLCPVALSLMARGVSEAEARVTAAQHRRRAAEIETRRRLAVAVAEPAQQRRRTSGQGFRIGGAR